jgi:hypothetical protein
MDDRMRTLAASTVIIGFLMVVAIIAGLMLSGRKVISPVPEDSAIKIIFISPTETEIPVASSSPTKKP